MVWPTIALMALVYRDTLDPIASNSKKSFFYKNDQVESNRANDWSSRLCKRELDPKDIENEGSPGLVVMGGNW